MIAAKTILPVLGVPVTSRQLKGLDSLLSIVQMPKGIPVATFAIGESGASNAALFAVALLAVEDTRLSTRLAGFRETQKAIVAEMTLPTMMSIRPGAMLGLLGGGQLGRMFIMAAQSMGYRVTVLDPADKGTQRAAWPTGICGRITSTRCFTGTRIQLRGVTTEFENVPAESLRDTGSSTVWSAPAANSVAIAQDRILEKNFLATNGFAVAPYAVIENSHEFGRITRLTGIACRIAISGFRYCFGAYFPGF